jgi:hypothetical protein
MDKEKGAVIIMGGSPMGKEDEMVSVEQDGYKPQVTIPKMNFKEIPQTEKFYIHAIASRVDGGEDEDSITIELDKACLKPYDKSKKEYDKEQEPTPAKSLEQSFDEEYEGMNQGM